MAHTKRILQLEFFRSRSGKMFRGKAPQPVLPLKAAAAAYPVG